MRAGFAGHPLLQVAALAAGLTSGSAFAAEWTLSPSGQFFTRSQQNPRLSSDETQEREVSTGVGAQAAAVIQRRTERLTISLQPTFWLNRFPDNSDLDRNEQNLDMSFNLSGEKVSWRGGAGASRDTTLTSELGSTGLTQANLRHESYNVSLGPIWQISELMQMRSTLSSQAHRYPGRENSDLENYRYTTASLTTSYVLSDRISLSLAGSAGRLSNEGPGGNSDNASVSVQAQYAWSPLWSLGVGVGPSWVRSGQGRSQGFLYSVDVSRVFEKSALSLSVSRSQSPSGRAIITDVEQANLALTMQLGERLTGSVTTGVTRRKNALRDFNLDLQRVRYTRADMGLSWRVTSSWQLGASIGNAVQQVGSAFFDNSTGRGYDARLTLSWNGEPYVN